MVAKRGLTNRANVHIPMWKSCLKHSTAEIQSIHQFWLQLDMVSEQKKKKIQNADAQVWDDARRDQKPETFVCALRTINQTCVCGYPAPHFANHIDSYHLIMLWLAVLHARNECSYWSLWIKWWKCQWISPPNGLNSQDISHILCLVANLRWQYAFFYWAKKFQRWTNFLKTDFVGSGHN